MCTHTHTHAHMLCLRDLKRTYQGSIELNSKARSQYFSHDKNFKISNRQTDERVNITYSMKRSSVSVVSMQNAF